MKTPYEMGYDAWFSGDISPEENPFYRTEADKNHQWMAGWYDAQIDDAEDESVDVGVY